AQDYLEQVERLGGAVAAVEVGFFQREIEEASWQFQREVETGQRIIVGVNKFVSPNSPLEEATPIQRIDDAINRTRQEEIRRFREARDGQSVRIALEALRTAARGAENLFPYVLEAFRRRATLGEVCGVLREEWGEYQPAY
ncbi:MAG: methylmalonyl-CoA mutase, partial [Meiothermus silvanus]|nr:methylmalonyl-CoA mutase [Allomeiothermus silvanus]